MWNKPTDNTQKLSEIYNYSKRFQKLINFDKVTGENTKERNNDNAHGTYSTET